MKTDKDLDEPEYDGNNIQLNFDQQSYGEQSVMEDSDNVTKTPDKEITRTREILEQTKSLMKDSSQDSVGELVKARAQTLNLYRMMSRR